MLVVVAIAIAAAIAAVAIGSLAAFATAVGNKQWWWVAGMAVFAPSALVYCMANRQLTQWPSKLLFRGCAALAVATVLFLAGKASLASSGAYPTFVDTQTYCIRSELLYPAYALQPNWALQRTLNLGVRLLDIELCSAMIVIIIP